MAEAGEAVLRRPSMVGDWGALADCLDPGLCRRGEAVGRSGREAVAVGPVLPRPAIEGDK